MKICILSGKIIINSISDKREAAQILAASLRKLPKVIQVIVLNDTVSFVSSISPIRLVHYSLKDFIQGRLYQDELFTHGNFKFISLEGNMFLLYKFNLTRFWLRFLVLYISIFIAFFQKIRNMSLFSLISCLLFIFILPIGLEYFHIRFCIRKFLQRIYEDSPNLKNSIG